MQSLFILGRQPALGLAELESLYGAASLRPVGSNAVILDINPDEVNFRRLGGSMKFGRVLTILDTTDWRAVEKYLGTAIPNHAAQLSEGKIQIGLSAYGLHVTSSQLLATGLTLKKRIKSTGRPVRLVPNKTPDLNTAQVIHNDLTGSHGLELLCVRSGDSIVIAQTIDVQDIASYTIRDRDRPKRDSRVGMLPPKLAQVIINLAASQNIPSPGFRILDPFCGTGVVLQEAILMGFGALGSDIEARMGEYTDANIEWLRASYPDTAQLYAGWQHGDATTARWSGDNTGTGDSSAGADPARAFDAVASETYLGRPFTTLPGPEILNQTITECNLIIKKFLRNIHSQLPANARLCLAVPAWQTRTDQFRHLPLLGYTGGQSVPDIDSLRNLGYNRISFEHARFDDLIYRREDQIVARELLVLEKL